MNADLVLVRKMRALGVRWKRGRLPVYPASMNDSQRFEANCILDSISEEYYNAMCSPVWAKQTEGKA